VPPPVRSRPAGRPPGGGTVGHPRGGRGGPPRLVGVGVGPPTGRGRARLGAGRGRAADEPDGPSPPEVARPSGCTRPDRTPLRPGRPRRRRPRARLARRRGPPARARQHRGVATSGWCRGGRLPDRGRVGRDRPDGAPAALHGRPPRRLRPRRHPPRRHAAGPTPRRGCRLRARSTGRPGVAGRTGRHTSGPDRRGLPGSRPPTPVARPAERRARRDRLPLRRQRDARRVRRTGHRHRRVRGSSCGTARHGRCRAVGRAARDLPGPGLATNRTRRRVPPRSSPPTRRRPGAPLRLPRRGVQPAGRRRPGPRGAALAGRPGAPGPRGRRRRPGHGGRRPAHRRSGERGRRRPARRRRGRLEVVAALGTAFDVDRSEPR